MRLLPATALACVFLAAPATGKPLSMQPDWELQRCVLAAEVEILEIDPPAGRRQRGEAGATPTGGIRVRVSGDPERVYRGFDRLGRTVELKFARGGPAGCYQDLARLAENGVRPLIAVRPGDEIAFVGIREEREGGAVYEMRHWCDWNAAWMFSIKDRFGKRLPRDDVKVMGGFEAGAAEIRELLKNAHAAFTIQVADHLTREPPADPEPIRQWIAVLGHEDFGVRLRAERQLIAAGTAALGPLHEARGKTRDPEVAARLAQILETFAADAAAENHAQALRHGPTDDQLRLLKAALEACGPEHEPLRLRINSRLKTLAIPRPKS